MRRMVKMVPVRMANQRGGGWSLVVEVLLLFKKTKVNQKWQKRRKSFIWSVHVNLLSCHSPVQTHDLCCSHVPVCFLQMFMTKTLLTEVLLEVTNEEIFQVAKETHRKATKGLLLFLSVCATVPSRLILKKSHIFTEIRLGYILTDKYEAFLSDWCTLEILNKQKCNSSSAILC